MEVHEVWLLKGITLQTKKNSRVRQDGVRQGMIFKRTPRRGGAIKPPRRDDLAVQSTIRETTQEHTL